MHEPVGTVLQLLLLPNIHTYCPYVPDTPTDRLVCRPFGYGRSYTTFEISQPTLNTAGGPLRVDSPATVLQASVTVKNTGQVAGDEVVFLFKKSGGPALAWHALASPAGPSGQTPPPTMPARELIGFGRVTLPPGGSAVVHFNTTVRRRLSLLC